MTPFDLVLAAVLGYLGYKFLHKAAPANAPQTFTLAAGKAYSLDYVARVAPADTLALIQPELGRIGAKNIVQKDDPQNAGLLRLTFTWVPSKATTMARGSFFSSTQGGQLYQLVNVTSA